MRVVRAKRGRGGNRRIDLSDFRTIIADRRTWTSLGIVTEVDGPHYELVTSDDGQLAVEVDVVLQPSGQPVVARLGISGGTWEVPGVGDEVAVVVPEGMVDFSPVIVARLSGARSPTDQQPAPDRVVIVSGQVLVHDGDGGAVPLALKSDVEAVDAKYEAHTHLGSGGPTGGPLNAGVAVPATPGAPLMPPTAGVITNPPNPTPPNVPPFLDYFTGVPTIAPFSEGSGLEPVTIVGTTVLLAK